ncbi:MAG TPA: cyclase family protein [Candidatus Paceibacterota bacterium]|nr:cyclase family protein [Candidatus Paceibacterota bacterium]
MKIIDISIPITNNTIIYPGDPVIVIEKHKSIPKDSSNISKISIGSHAGTHIDAPLHSFENGNSIDSYQLENFVGKCSVLDFSNIDFGDSIKISDLEKNTILEGDRILCKTKNSDRGFSEFYSDFVYLDGDAAEFLAMKNIKLFGIDYLSVKQKGSKDNRSHTALLSKNIPILETINLKNVSPGEYELFCPPIKFAGIDGAPTRAILIKN